MKGRRTLGLRAEMGRLEDGTCELWNEDGDDFES